MIYHPNNYTHERWWQIRTFLRKGQILTESNPKIGHAYFSTFHPINANRIYPSAEDVVSTIVRLFHGFPLKNVVIPPVDRAFIVLAMLDGA